MFPSCKRSILLELSFFCFLWASQALVLNSPRTPLIIGSSFQVTWTSVPGDPPSFNLDTVCTTLARFGPTTTITLTSHPVNTGAGVASVIPSPSQFGSLGGIQRDIPCEIRATSSIDGSVVLATADVTLSISGSSPLPTSSTVPSSSSSSLDILTTSQTPSDLSSTVLLTPTTTSTSDISPSSTSTAFFVASTTSNQTTSSLTKTRSSTTLSKFSAAEHTTATSNSSTFFRLPSATTQTMSISGVDPTSTFPAISTGTLSADGSAVATSSTTTSAPQASNSKATPTSAIAGGTAGGVVVLAVFGFIIFMLRRRRREFQNKKLEELNSGADDEWFGPPPGTRSPGPADFDGGITPQEMIQHRIYAYNDYSPSIETGYQGPQGRADNFAHEYQEHDPFASSPVVSSGRIRHHADYSTRNLSSSSNGSTSGLLPPYV